MTPLIKENRTMPSFLLKPDAAIDFYVYWSTIVDAPTRWGQRSEMEAEDIERELTSDRFDRADEFGTSAHNHRHYGWGDKWIFEQKGIVSHAVLADLCGRIEAGQPADDLLEPIES